MSDIPEKTSLSDTLASLLLENRQAIGLALFIAIYRSRDTVSVEDVNLMKW